MNEYLVVLAFAALPALGNFAGGALAEFVPVSRLMLNLALYSAAGVVVAVVAVELMPRALEADPAWAIVLAFVLGGVFYVAVDWAIQRLNDRYGGEGGAGPWVIFFGVSVDLFSDGIMVGTGSTVAVGLGLLLALGQVPSDIPEGFATVANFRRRGVPRSRRLLLSAAFAAPIFLGATLGYWLMRDASELNKLLLLTFTAGVLSTLVVEELVPEAVEEVPESPLSSLAFSAASPSSRCSLPTWRWSRGPGRDPDGLHEHGLKTPPRSPDGHPASRPPGSAEQESMNLVAANRCRAEARAGRAPGA